MKRAEIVNAGQPLAVVTREVVDTPVKGLLLKTSYAGVCHTDVHFLRDEKDLGDGKIRRVRDLIGMPKEPFKVSKYYSYYTLNLHYC